MAKNNTTRTPISGATKAKIDELIQRWREGGGFAHHATIPELPEDGGPYTREYLDQARLLDVVTNIVRAANPGRGDGQNPTAAVLDYLIEVGAITNAALIVDVAAVNAKMILTGASDYVPGLGWPRLCLARTDDLKPILMPPAIRSRDLRALPGFVVGLWEHEWVYFRNDNTAPLGIVPAYGVTVRAAAALTGWHPCTIYTKTSGQRRDWQLDACRIRPDDNTRGVIFEPRGFWEWLLSKRRR